MLVCYSYEINLNFSISFISDANPQYQCMKSAGNNCLGKCNNTSKETKTKKPNWGIKFNCARLKNIKSSSSSQSSERKFYNNF